MPTRLLAALAAFLLFSVPAWATDPPAPTDSMQQMREQIEKSLTYETGKIDLGKGLATPNCAPRLSVSECQTKPVCA